MTRHTVSVSRLKVLMNKAHQSVESLKVGDLFRGAFGSAKQDGITDTHERSLYTTFWLSRWHDRKGVAGHQKDQPDYVISIEG
jgi:hypothetical protein